MKLLDKNLTERAKESLRICLERVPFLKIESIQRGPVLGAIQADFIVKIIMPNSKQDLVIEVKNNGQPRIAREAVNLLLRYRTVSSDIYGVFMAPYISSKSAEILSKEGIGYVDLAGNCRLFFNQVYIEQRGKANYSAKKRDLRSLYSPKAERVLRVILVNRQKKWKVKDLSEEAAVSLGQVSNVKKLLLDREWIHTGPDGFILNEPDLLLAEWSENYTYRKNQIREFYSLNSVLEIETELARICNRKNLNYALTGFSGAARLAPTVRYNRITAYVQETAEDLASLLNLKEVSSGANISLLTPYDGGIFYGVREIEGIRVVNPVQIFLDVKGFRGRGEEAAKAVLERIINPQW